MTPYHRTVDPRQRQGMESVGAGFSRPSPRPAEGGLYTLPSRFHDLRGPNDLRTEELMRTTILALLSLVTAAAAQAQWEPPGALQLPNNGGEPRVYFVHSYYHDHPN